MLRPSLSPPTVRVDEGVDFVSISYCSIRSQVINCLWQTREATSICLLWSQTALHRHALCGYLPRLCLCSFHPRSKVNRLGITPLYSAAAPAQLSTSQLLAKRVRGADDVIHTRGHCCDTSLSLLLGKRCCILQERAGLTRLQPGMALTLALAKMQSTWCPCTIEVRLSRPCLACFMRSLVYVADFDSALRTPVLVGLDSTGRIRALTVPPPTIGSSAWPMPPCR